MLIGRVANLPQGDYELRATLVGFSTIVLKLTVEKTMPPLKIRMRVAERRPDMAIILIKKDE